MTRSLADTRRCIRLDSITASVINPKPPIWIITRITACPKPLQVSAVSVTTSPVTQVALTAVKAQSAKGTGVPLREAMGRCRRDAPIKITQRKPRINICGVVRPRFFFTGSPPEHSYIYSITPYADNFHMFHKNRKKKMPPSAASFMHYPFFFWKYPFG